MNETWWLKSFLILVMMAGLLACAEDMDDDNDVMKVSAHNTFASHNDGQVCQNCHTSGGSGEGIFTVAGTVYEMANLTQTYPNTTIHLYTEMDGQGSLVMSIEVDGRGNFYTTRDVNWGTGLYPAVTSPMGTVYMQSATTEGDCNDCHDAVSRIYAN